MPGKAAARLGVSHRGSTAFISTSHFISTPRLGPASADLGKVQAGLFHLGPPRGMSSRSGSARLGVAHRGSTALFPLPFIFALRVLAPHRSALSLSDLARFCQVFF